MRTLCFFFLFFLKKNLLCDAFSLQYNTLKNNCVLGKNILWSMESYFTRMTERALRVARH